MTLRKPSIFFRIIILGAQGVFYNLFCKCQGARRNDAFNVTDVQSCLILFPLEYAIASLRILKRRPS